MAGGKNRQKVEKKSKFEMFQKPVFCPDFDCYRHNKVRIDEKT